MALARPSSVHDPIFPVIEGKRPGFADQPTASRWSCYIDYAILASLTLFAITLPYSIKGAERSWKVAFALWLLKLVIDRARPYKQALAAPLLAYVTLSAISTLLSPNPNMSWDRMKFVCLFLVGVVVAQTLKRVSQVRWLVLLLVLSGLTAAMYTGWQYTYGVGVRLVQFSESSKLAQDGLRPGDLVVSFDGHKVHSPEQLVQAVQQTTAPSVNIEYVPGLALRSSTMVVAPRDFVQAGLGTPAMTIIRGKPDRAQGTLGHYVIFAEMLTQIGCMAWALLLSSGRKRPIWLLLFGVCFAGIAAALLTTQTRAAVGGLLIGCVASLWYFTRRKTRVAAIALLIVLLAGSLLWIQHTRRIDVLDRGDTGANFRVLMWEDGVRLVREHPWFGVGMETVRVHYQEWNIRGFLQYHVLSHFHSTYLQIAVERGIPALLAWLWFCVAYLLFLVRLIPKLRAHSQFAGGVAVGALAGLLSFTFTGFFHYNLGEESLAMIFFFYFGLAVALERMVSTPGAVDVE